MQDLWTSPQTLNLIKRIQTLDILSQKKSLAGSLRTLALEALQQVPVSDGHASAGPWAPSHGVPYQPLHSTHKAFPSQARMFNSFFSFIGFTFFFV